MSAVRVTVDPAACECSGYCERIAETVFSLGDEYPFISVELPIISDPALIERVLEAEATCPGRAILVERVRRETKNINDNITAAPLPGRAARPRGARNSREFD